MAWKSLKMRDSGPALGCAPTHRRACRWLASVQIMTLQHGCASWCTVVPLRSRFPLFSEALLDLYFSFNSFIKSSFQPKPEKFSWKLDKTHYKHTRNQMKLIWPFSSIFVLAWFMTPFYAPFYLVSGSFNNIIFWFLICFLHFWRYLIK